VLRDDEIAPFGNTNKNAEKPERLSCKMLLEESER